jgi:hypothetical protein
MGFLQGMILRWISVILLKMLLTRYAVLMSRLLAERLGVTPIERGAELLSFW